jgi:hypothetical protein
LLDFFFACSLSVYVNHGVRYTWLVRGYHLLISDVGPVGIKKTYYFFSLSMAILAAARLQVCGRGCTDVVEPGLVEEVDTPGSPPCSPQILS